jgi:hypothetical protein
MCAARTQKLTCVGCFHILMNLLKKDERSNVTRKSQRVLISLDGESIYIYKSPVLQTWAAAATTTAVCV